MNNRKIWKYIDYPEQEIYKISEKTNLSLMHAKILHNAGYKSEDYKKINFFMNPSVNEIKKYQGVSSSRELEKSCQRIQKAIKNKEKVVINGDPDADGISGTAILTIGLTQLGLNVGYKFPVRSKEGHGLQIRIIQEALDEGASLIITTDCGTKDVEAVEFANKNNIDVIITDHHILGNELPNAIAIINPQLNDGDAAGFRSISGSYVSFKWIMALSDYFDVSFSKEIYESLVIYASFGVISDRVSLLNLMNRSIVKLGIKYLNSTKLPGITALKNISIKRRPSIEARDISRTIAPRMNAPGRIGDPSIGIPDSSIVVELLTYGLDIGKGINLKNSIKKYKDLLSYDFRMKSSAQLNNRADIVDDVNQKRKKITEDIESKIERDIQGVDIENKKLLIIKGEQWNSGVIGIDADRLRDRFVKPAIIMTSVEGSDYCKGSVRSIPSIDMYHVMENVQKIFMERHRRNPYSVCIKTLKGECFVNAFGGHAQACGFSIHKKDIDEWERLVNSEMDKIPEAQFDFYYYITEKINFDDISLKFLKGLDKLAPYGQGFDYPVFSLSNVSISKKARFFGNQMQKDKTPHVEFKVFKSAKNASVSRNQFLVAVGFGLKEKYSKMISLYPESQFDLVFTLDYPLRQHTKQLMPQLIILDIEKSGL